MRAGVASPGPSGTPGRQALATAAILALGLCAQVAILQSAPPGAQHRDDVGSSQPISRVITQVFTAEVASRANVATGDGHVAIWQIGARDVITSPFVVGGQLEPPGSAVFSQVVANLVSLFVDESSFVGTLRGLLPGFPLVITATTQALEPGVHHQRVRLSLDEFRTLEMFQPVLVQPAPAFDVFRRYPALALTSDVITYSWQVRPLSDVITDTFVTGELLGSGIFRSVVSNQGRCESLGLSTFACTVGRLDAPLFITVTAEALQEGRQDHRLGLDTGRGDSLVVTSTTMAHASPQPAARTVGIDIKPGDTPNSLNPRSHGTTPVAILSDPMFNVPGELDQTSLTFGRTGDEQSLAFCRLEDTNDDGLLDLLCQFNTEAAGFRQGDTAGILKGVTFTGTHVRGTDSVRIVPDR
jgi:prepilin-type processing-associated H-X9-DG protein